MPEIRLPHAWEPRDYQLPFLRHMERFAAGGGGRAVLVWHRRSGKDATVLNFTACAAHRRTGVYWHMLPTAAQARKAVWDGIDATGRKVLEQVFPRALRAAANATEMKIELKCGSVWQLVGSDNYNSLVGANPVGVVFSEYSLADPAAWDYVRPILAENGGWAAFIFTPRGRNHGHALLEMARRNPDWFAQVLTVDDTRRADGSPVIGPAAIAEDRAAGMAEEMLRQEYWCSFDAALTGSYYGRALEAARREGRIGKAPWEPALPVETWWDLGMSDSTAIWFAQRMGEEVRLIDYLEASGEGLPYYVDVLRAKPYAYGRHIAPHDIEVRELGTGKSRREIALKLGIRFEVAPAQSLADGIEAARAMLPACRFDETACARGLEALTQYRRAWNAKTRDFSTTPLHDWCFTGDTEILTRYGTYQIIKLPQTGEVLTPCGWKPYQNPRRIQKNAQLVAVTFADGFTVRCTPDHTFLTARGWISAEHLQPGTSIRSSLTRLHSILMAACIVCGQVRGICREAGDAFIGMFGWRRSAKSRRAATSTIGMGTFSIINWIISSASRAASIFRLPGKRTKPIGPNILRKTLESEQQRGIGPKKGGSGTSVMPNEPNRGRNGSVNASRACIAVRSSMHWFAQAVIRRSFVLTHAKRLTIASVKHLEVREDVWCLTVPDGECFSLANGAVVHNCSHGADAFRYGAVARGAGKLGRVQLAAPHAFPVLGK